MKEMIDAVYKMLQNREVHPSGAFDAKGRFYAKHTDLISVREPSRSWPFSHMIACRTKKYVKAVAVKFNCSTIDEILANI